MESVQVHTACQRLIKNNDNLNIEKKSRMRKIKINHFGLMIPFSQRPHFNARVILKPPRSYSLSNKLINVTLQNPFKHLL